MTSIFDSEVFQKLKKLDLYSKQLIDALMRSPTVDDNNAANNLNELKQDILKTNLYVDIPSILPSLVDAIPEWYSNQEQEKLTTWIRQILQKVNLASFTRYLLTDNMHAIGQLSLSHLSDEPTTLCQSILSAFIDLRTRLLYSLALENYSESNSPYSTDNGIDMDSLLEQALSLDPLSYGFGSQEYTVPFMEDVKKRREKIFSLDDLDDLNTLIPLDRLKNSCESAIIYHNLRTPTISVNNILLEPNTLDNVDIYMQRKSATGIKFKKHNVTNDNNSLLQEATTNDTVIDLQKLNNKSDTSPVHPTLAKSTEGLSHHITNDDSDTSSIYLSPTETIQEQSHNITEINNDSDTSSILPTPSTSAEEHSRHHIYTDSSSIHPSLEETVQEQRNHNIDLIRSPSSSNHSISDDVIQEPRHEMMGENSLSEQRQHVENHIYPYSTQLPADEERREFDQTPTPEEEEEEELYELDTSDEEFDLGKNIDNNNTTDDFDKDNTESSDSPNDGGNNQDPCISGNSGFPPGYLVDSNLDDDGNHVPTLAIERKRNHSSSGDQQEERSYKRQTLSTTGYEKDKSLQFTDDIDEHLFSQSPPGSQGISQQRQQVQQSSVALQSSSPLPSSASETSQAPLSPLALPSSLELQTSQASPSPSILLASPIPGSPSPSQSSSATESSQTSSRPTTIGASTSINNRKTFIGRTRIRKRGNVINSAPRSPVAIRWNDSDDEFIPDSVNNSDSDEESISDDVNDMDSTRQGRRQLPTTMRPLQKEHSRARPIPYRRRYTTWTNDELDALKEGLGYFKGNKWIAIKNRHAERLRNRTNVDLRDKARNEIERRQKEGLPLEEFQYVC